jgi:hypothetical protein
MNREAALKAAPPPSQLHFIYHSAYCCSTLLANALDVQGSASSLKEPTILNDLSGWVRRGGPPARVAQAMDGALNLLACPFGEGEAVVAKPSNVINSLAPLMLTMRPQARALLLFAPLKIYLGSIAAKGLWGRLWVRDLLVKQLKDGIVKLGFDKPEDHLLQTDLQVAAVGWLAQHQLFASLARRFPDRVRTLDSETLLQRPEDSLAALHRLFQLRPGKPGEENAGLEAFGRNAKTGESFGRGDRSAAQRSAAEVHNDELEKVFSWALAVAETANVDLELPSPLL